MTDIHRCLRIEKSAWSDHFLDDRTERGVIGFSEQAFVIQLQAQVQPRQL